MPYRTRDFLMMYTSYLLILWYNGETSLNETLTIFVP